MKIKGLSIFSQMLIFFLGMAILINGVLTVIFYSFTANSLKRQTDERIFQELLNIEHRIDNDLNRELIKELNLLASNPIIDDFLMSSPVYKEISFRSMENLLLSNIAFNDSYKNIYFVNNLGREEAYVSKVNGRVRDFCDLKETRIFNEIKSASPKDIRIEGPLTDKDGDVFFKVGIHKIDNDIGRFGGAIIIDYSLAEFFTYLDI